MTKVSDVASSSSAIGSELSKLLAEPGLTKQELESKLNGLRAAPAAAGRDARRRSARRGSCATSSAPRSSRCSSASAACAGSRTRSGGRSDFTSSDEAATLLAAQVQRLLTSDIIWDDLFKTPTTDVLKSEGVTRRVRPGVQVPHLARLRQHGGDEVGLGAAAGRVRRRGTPTGVHGTGIESVKVLPGETELSQDTETTITVTQDLAFEVAVKDTGDSEEVQVQVDLTIQRTPTPIKKTETIDAHQRRRDEDGRVPRPRLTAVRQDDGEGGRRCRCPASRTRPTTRTSTRSSSRSP